MGKYKQGESGNPAGRKKGVPNKVARPIKEQLSDFLNEKIQELPGIWEKLSARDKANFIKDLVPYFVAQLQTIQVGLEFSQLSDEQLDEIINGLISRNDEKN